MTDRTHLLAAITEKFASVLLQGREMLRRDLIPELPYDAEDIASAGMEMIVTVFRLACYHGDTISLPTLGTFQPIDNTVQFLPSNQFDVCRRMIDKMSRLPEFGGLTEISSEEIQKEIHDSLVEAGVELNSDILCKIIAEQLVPIFSAPPEDIAEKMLSVWEETVVLWLKLGASVRLGIGTFSFFEKPIQKIAFIPDEVLIRSIQAGDWRRKRLSPPEES
jgi:hypothetical protein